jgi:exo-beta-1,3-glucanase (GH17 family)
LRLYDCDQHAEAVLEVIRQEKLPFDVMLGAYIVAEVNNYECPWGGMYANVELEANITYNQARIQKLIQMANAYPDIISSVSAGNEAAVSWTDHLVPTASLLSYVLQLKEGVNQPVTFCENYVPWLNSIKQVGEAVDFISIHTYPVWEYKDIHEAMNFTMENYYSVADLYPEKQVVITEAGWATNSNGRGICPTNVCEVRQEKYYNELVNWREKEYIVTFVFEAFDELWKGSHEEMEPEKHWGLFTIDRKPKKVMQQFYPGLCNDTV